MGSERVTKNESGIESVTESESVIESVIESDDTKRGGGDWKVEQSDGLKLVQSQERRCCACDLCAFCGVDELLRGR